jgi:hypothetical protein
MLPQFPKFKKIELTDRVDVEKHTNLFEPYSDFEFTCLWAWDMKGERMISELNGNLVVKFTEYNTHKPFLSFLGKNDCEKTARTLIEYCKNNNLPTVLQLMPDISIQGLDPKEFFIEERRGDFDYIFSTKKLAILTGNDLKSKRTNANKFWRENPSARLEQIDLNDKKIQIQIFETISKWEDHKNTTKKNYEIEHELSATQRLVESDCLASLICMGLYFEDVMIGYVIGEKVTNGYLMCHFLRSIVFHVGVNEALMQGYAKYLDSLGIIYINFESDLDHETIRQFKMSWRPVKFLKRYDVRYMQK